MDNKKVNLDRALKDFKDRTGVDYMKMLMGDESEKQKWREKLSDDKKRIDESEKEMDEKHRDKFDLFAKEYAENCPNKYNGMAYVITENIKNATHWLALEDDNNIEHNEEQVTVGRAYRLYEDKYENDIFILNDERYMSDVILSHQGHCIILENSDEWYKFIESKLR